MSNQELLILHIIFRFNIEIHHIFLLSSRLKDPFHLFIKGWQWELAQRKNFQLVLQCHQRMLLILVSHLVEFLQEGYGLKVVEFVLVLLLTHWQQNNYNFSMNYLSIAVVIAFVSISMGHPIEIIDVQPHNKNCYSQGLFFLNDTHLFETCGLYNESYFHIMKYQAQPFEITNEFSSPIPWKLNIFIEGAILFKDHLYILTWREWTVYKLDPETFKVVKQLKWNKEGWGLTHNGTHMFTTDGSEYIFVVDQNFRIVDQKPITTKMGRRLRNINQLEHVDGFIYANIYLDSQIVKIDYSAGKVVQEYDGSDIVSKQRKNGALRSDEVINGIAYDKKSEKFLITGKHWSSIYQVVL